MKTLRYILMISTVVLAQSCLNDWLTLEPSTSVETETSITGVSEVEFALNGIYDVMRNPYAYSGRLVYYGDVTGDDMMAQSTSKRSGSYYRFAYTKDNVPSTHWSYLYTIIQNCNSTLQSLNALTVSDSEKKTADDYRGQLLTIRAMAYFDLVKIFAYPYTKDNGASPGVPIVLGTSSISDKPGRSTVAEVYSQVIIKDLEEAIGCLSTSYSKGKINRFAAMGLLSRVYLYHNDNKKSFDMAAKAIADATSAGYKLWTNSEYPTAWKNDHSSSNKGEVLFELVIPTDEGQGKETMGYLSSKDGYDDVQITVSFYHLLKEDPDDVRLKLLVNDGKKYMFVNKYQPQGDKIIQDANIPLIRLSELYLNAAEAAVKLGDNEGAVTYLDPIVRRANPANTVSGTEVTLDRVLTERRKELVDEGHRMFDVIRNGLTVKRVNESDSMMSKTKHFASDMEYDWDFYKIILPIPKYEMDANPNLSGQQNPGY